MFNLQPGKRLIWADLHELKPTLLYEYHERAGILEYDARLPRDEAERRAINMVLTGKDVP